jgi:hypothetical protein|tara:strand:+ start:702 stop:995 length:294 start_codon:yes stop_codon:yes gene_type:complete
VELAQLVNEYGFPIVMMVGLGYFIYFIWHFISEHIEPEIEKMHFALIRVIDQTRMLDQDMIRLQQKVNVVLEYRERQKVIDDAAEKAELETLKAKGK